MVLLLSLQLLKLLFYFQLQKLLFSATLSQNPEKLQQLNLFQPRLFTSVVDNPAQSKTPRAGSVEMGSDTGDQIKDRLTDPGGEVKGQFVGKYTTPLGLKVCRIYLFVNLSFSRSVILGGGVSVYMIMYLNVSDFHGKILK